MAFSDVLILPGSLAYVLALEELPPPPGWLDYAAKMGGEMGLIAPVGGNGILEAVSLDRFQEYANDGELDVRQQEIDDLLGEDDGLGCYGELVS